MAELRADPAHPPQAQMAGSDFLHRRTETEIPRPSFGRESGWAQKLSCPHWARKEGLPGPDVKGGASVSLRVPAILTLLPPRDR